MPLPCPFHNCSESTPFYLNILDSNKRPVSITGRLLALKIIETDKVFVKGSSLHDARAVFGGYALAQGNDFGAVFCLFAATHAVNAV